MTEPEVTGPKWFILGLDQDLANDSRGLAHKNVLKKKKNVFSSTPDYKSRGQG